jgi:hypothetical protein
MGRISRSTVFHRFRRKARADHVDAVASPFRRYLRLLAAEGEAVIADLDVEVLGHLVAIDRGADGHADLVSATQWRAFALDALFHRSELALGRVEELVAFACAFAG